MAQEISLEKLARWLLYICGAILMLAGVVGLLYDFVSDLRISEYGSIIVLILGAVMLIATSLVFVVVPQYREKERLEKLRQHYKDRPQSELRDINHNIIDAAQAAILGIELAASFSHECLDRDITPAERKDKVTAGKTTLDQANRDIARLKHFVDVLGDYVNTRS
jgi:hypothetical protein